MKPQRIFLTGFMGAGKSTIGPILANVLGWEFADLDKLIEKEVDDSISNIFAAKGESFFREKESEMLLKATLKENFVLALGGGTLINKDNLNLVKRSGVSIYLKSSPEEIYHRLKHKTDRPLLLSENGTPLSYLETKEKISSILKTREEIYNQADIIYLIDGVSVGKTVDDLVRLIKRKLRV